jgi:hypothetical protein
MTQDEIMSMAKEVYGDIGWTEASLNRLKAVIELAVAKEREAILKMLEDALKAGRIINFTFALKAIRARTKEQK